ncbi:MAG: right-handed parallel beta-helix repeat-containing protein [Armatimonadetes bacterium]|nr:right-handed parallel beta-helix repeat-containing protein [Armatimonadota bacterium]MDE2205668.1 right-handed parallel beta-helix repeat-containing protein [Armatimonadota bacterium]
MILYLLLMLGLRHASVIKVGDGCEYPRIEQAVAAAAPGDTIQVYGATAGYHRVAVKVDVAGITIQGMGPTRIVLDGVGFDYSGAGKVPRAVFQVDPSAAGTTIENFEISGAHNSTFNGAGIRINAADGVTVRDCDIHDCDMGIMSNGSSAATGGSDQVITRCRIHGNGSLKDPGFNHNLYLAGQSVTVRFCDIFGSLTGHNLKSRAHFIKVEYCFIHDAANRELDLVEDNATARPNSNALLLGNLIVKDPACSGNRVVIQFGRETGMRTGTVYLINNTIITPFVSAVVSITSPGCTARLYNNIICNQTSSRPRLLEGANGGSCLSAAGSGNWFSDGYSLQGTNLLRSSQTFGRRRGESPFLGSRRVCALRVAPGVAHWRDGSGLVHDAVVRYRYAGAGKWRRSDGSHIGA